MARLEPTVAAEEVDGPRATHWLRGVRSSLVATDSEAHRRGTLSRLSAPGSVRRLREELDAAGIRSKRIWYRDEGKSKSLVGEMTRQLFTTAATMILWAHVAVIAFNVVGLIVIPLGAWRAWRFVRVFWWRALHLGALVLVALQAVLGQACFLTIWQSDLLARAGESTSNEPMIQQWINRIIFCPFPLRVFAVLYVGVFIYTLLLWRLVPPQLPWDQKPSRT